jgi:hypothetical protein
MIAAILEHPAFENLRRFFWLLMVFSIGLEDFQRVDQFRLTHSHSYQKGISHSHPEIQGRFTDILEESEKSHDRTPNSHTHLIEVVTEVPAVTPPQSEKYSAQKTNCYLAVTQRSLYGPSRTSGCLLRPPKGA